ncbi:MAG: ABC transporter substrate-binding protein [Candidatus Acidiferrales bacterium]
MKTQAMPSLRMGILCAVFAEIGFASLSVQSAKHYDPGATAAEINIGNIMPYTGAFSEYGATGKAEAAYFQMINDAGGVKGRKINFISVDGESDWKKAPEQARKLVEDDQVLLLFSNFGYPANKAIRAYMNEKKVPQLFVASNDSVFDDPASYPWTMGFAASKRTEALVYARYILREKPKAKIAILAPSDPSGDEWRSGTREGLGDKASTMIVKDASFTYREPKSVEATIAQLKDSGADVLLNFTVGRFTTLAIRAAWDLDWHPLQFIPNSSLSNPAFLEPAGLHKAAGIITNARSKGWTSERDQTDPDVRQFIDWMKKYDPDANPRDANVVFGYEVSELMVAVLKNCGDDLTRANVLKQATNLDLTLGMLLPEIRVTTSPTDYQPIKQLYLTRFDGAHWVLFGNVIRP